MQPETVRRLQQLQEQAAQLGKLAQELAAATPQRSEGSDETGWVRVVLGSNGLPTEISIRPGWQRRLSPEQLGGAVLSANSDAVQRATRQWTDQLDESRWWMRRDDLDRPVSRESAAGSAGLTGVPAGRVLEPTELAEDVMAALQAVQRQPAVPPASVAGLDDGGHVRVTLGLGGLTGCKIDLRWAADCPSAAISAAISSAVKRAVAERTALAAPSAEINTMLGDALATLTSLTNLTSGGDR